MPTARTSADLPTSTCSLKSTCPCRCPDTPRPSSCHRTGNALSSSYIPPHFLHLAEAAEDSYLSLLSPVISCSRITSDAEFADS
eukprot:753201-Hanusia_phi.AAC.5